MKGVWWWEGLCEGCLEVGGACVKGVWWSGRGLCEGRLVVGVWWWAETFRSRPGAP